MAVPNFTARTVAPGTVGEPSTGHDLPDPPVGRGWNFNVLLFQGTFFEAARYLASPRLVLPFLYIALGAPVVFAGVLSPLVQFSQLVAQIVAAPLVTSSRTRKWYVMLCSFAMASGLAVFGLARTASLAYVVAAVFLSAALGLGIFRGVNTLAYNDLIFRTLEKSSRNTLVYVESAVAGAIAICIAWYVHRILAGATPLQSHLNLLWAGASITALAAILIALIREPASTDPERTPMHGSGMARGWNPYIAELKEGLRRVAHVDWFGRYVIARTLMVSVELAMPFYAVHAATLHAEKPGSLNAFVVASSAAVILGGPIWRWVGRSSQRAVMVLGAALAALGGVWALIIEVFPALQHLAPHAVVFGLVAAGTQGVVGARTLYLVNTAPDQDRPYYTAVSNTISGMLGVPVALFLGSIALIHGAEWPVLLVVVLNILTGLACIRLRNDGARLPSKLTPNVR